MLLYVQMNLTRWMKISAVLAAAFFNNWLLGIILNHRLFLAGGSVSEFSAGGQHYAWVFRVLDIVAGLAMVLLGLLIFKARGGRYWRWLAIFILILGLSNCADALLPLPCSGTLDAACSAPVRINIHRVSLPDHALSSAIIGLLFVLIPLLGGLYARLTHNRRFEIVSVVTLVAVLLFFGLLAGESFFENGIIDHLAGYAQELQMLVFGWWLTELVQLNSPEAENKN